MSPHILEYTFNHMDFDRELTFKFFVIFSMFEHALKEGGFRLVGQNGDVQPNWDLFAQTINDQFDANINPELAAAVNYLLGHPPKKQVFRDNHLTFEQTRRPENISDTVWLSLLIRRVRNNLFHGGKVNYERHRDTLLIQFSIIILESWAMCNRNVQTALHAIQ